MSLPCEAHKRDRVENLHFQPRKPVLYNAGRSLGIYKTVQKRSTFGESQKVDYFGNFCPSPGGALSYTPIWITGLDSRLKMKIFHPVSFMCFAGQAHRSNKLLEKVISPIVKSIVDFHICYEVYKYPSKTFKM